MAKQSGHRYEESFSMRERAQISGDKHSSAKLVLNSHSMVVVHCRNNSLNNDSRKNSLNNDNSSTTS